MIRLIIQGEVTPYTRIGQERWTERAQKYFASRDRIKADAWSQMVGNEYEPIPARTPFALTVRFERRKLWTADCDNLLKALADALQGVCYPDDRWLAEIVASKVLAGAGGDVATVEIQEIK